jgi:hypothetical protein
MGEKCLEVFREAAQLGGIPAKARLAALAKMTSAEAQASEDDPAVIAKLRRALDQLRLESKRRNSGTFSAVVPHPSHHPPSDAGGGLSRLRKHIEAVVDLMSQRALLLGNAVDTARRVNESACMVLGVARVSVWLLDDRRTKITCLDLFESKPRKHTSGVELFAKDYAPYFDALLTESTIMAHDAVTDFRTRCFATSYLEPLGIGAMLDVPIWTGGKMVGVVCHEHIGGSRTWNEDEERFGYLMSNFLALSMERSKPAATDPPARVMP